MAGDVLQFIPRGDDTPAVISYDRVPASVIGKLFVELRGADNDDCFVIVDTMSEERHLVQCSCLNGAPVTYETGETLVDLLYWVEDNAPKSDELDDYAVCFGEEGLNAVYLRGDESVIGVGYLDCACCPKGMMMASLIAYCFALLNVDNDERLMSNAFSYLPFESAIGLSQYFYAMAEGIMLDELSRE